MSAPNAWSDLLRFAGGLAIFIFAIKHVTECLRSAAGPTMRKWIARATRRRATGVALGMLFGLLLRSGPSVIILIGFLHAGLLTLPSAVPPIIGANIGASLSMHLISFKMGIFYFIPIALGTVLSLTLPRRPWEQTGGALVGFGFLFLGMNLIADAVTPHRSMIEPWLALAQGSGLSKQLLAVGISIAATIAMQSSGAMIGVLFALASAGVFKDLAPVLPFVLGAEIGTCSTALIASAGMSADARRGAWSHLLFNVITTAIALALAPQLVAIISRTSPDLVRQIANLYTTVVLLGATCILIAQPLFIRLVRGVVRSKGPDPVSSFLDDALIEKPEQAIYQAIRELQRVARIGRESFRLNGAIMFKLDRNILLTIRKNEDAIDEIQRAMDRYLRAITSRYLSRRQSIILQHLNRCMTDIERIGDHNDNLADLAEQRHSSPGATFPSEAQTALFNLFEAADKVLMLVIQSLNPEITDFQLTARIILHARDEYMEKSINAKALFAEKVEKHEYTPIVGIFLSEYVDSFDRIVRHSKMIALAVSQPYFWIKRRKLERVAPELPTVGDARGEPSDFLDKLQSEGMM